MPIDQIAKSRPYIPNDTDWKLIYNVLPGETQVADPAVINPQFECIEVTGNAVLPAKGMYVVLRGVVQLRQDGKPLASADVGDYFYEEHLQITDIPVSLEALALDGTRLAFLSSEEWKQIPADIRKPCFGRMFGDLLSVQIQNFQQPINCCSVTAAALSMSALGFSCEVNDIFRECALPSSFVVNDGISLGELFDVACTYIHSQGLRERVQVQAYFMDGDTTDVPLLLEAIDESNQLGGDNDILVANFQVGVAHGKENMPGGHFAVIAKCNASTGLVHMMDVHPEKYGKLWVTTIQRLWEAMSDRDGTSMRSRGILRFSARAAVKSHLKTFKQRCNYIDSTRYLAKDPKKRRNLFRRATPNLNSLGVLVESLAIHGDHQVDEDKLLQATESSFTDAVSRVATAKDMHEMAKKYLSQSEDVHVDSSFHSFETRDDKSIQTPEDWFKAQLKSLKVNKDRHLMINIDFNRVTGINAIEPPKNVYRETALLEEFWCLCIDYDEDEDVVTIVDMSPATSQVWQAPRGNIFRGLRDLEDPALVLIEEVEPPEDPGDVDSIIKNNPMVLFYEDEDPWSYMLRSILSNIGATSVKQVDVGGRDPNAIKMRRQLVSLGHKPKVPYLFFKGKCISKSEKLQDIVDMIKSGHLQDRMRGAGLPVSKLDDTPSLNKNMFGYPKGVLNEVSAGKRNVLLCACGSSAADKIPELVERIVDAGHNVKLIPSVSAEKFFRDFGAERIDAKITHNDYYRDDDEWNFRYMEFDMPVRASHLALCDWADCVIVAPITCNTMGKVANGIADNLLTSVFVAWQYQKKPVILCPACNTNMWNNITTQNNVSKLKMLGADLIGPREGRLSNGRMGIGMMATPDQIMEALGEAFEELDDQKYRVCKWAREAAAADDINEWKRVFRVIDEGIVGVNIVDETHGDSLLHYAAGGEGELNEGGHDLGKPDYEAAQDLIDREIDVNIVNDHGFTALHVAVMNKAPKMVEILLAAEGMDATSCIEFVQGADISPEIRAMLDVWARDHNLKMADAEQGRDESFVTVNEPSYLYFTYGSLKQGFPNHDAHNTVLNDFVGTARTRQPMPLIVPKEPFCDNPNCKFLHRMATLVDQQGMGKQVSGEVYRVTESGLHELDRLEGYHGPGSPENVYIRKKINVVVDGVMKPAYAYVIADPAKYLQGLRDGTSEMVNDYTLDMAQGELKPGFKSED
ncbi:flavoprotein [uncultured Ruegeria sp.]|uniref:flavoprotein n=1 Tax=uncultured Ruegeria sp. TaxID=259304 RepID=UPI0026098FB0|nr:flavoprotein [uncultured Ruegeria sp.]